MSQGYYNDLMNRNIVLIAFLFFYGYLSFNSSKLKRTRNWSSVSCNPFEMLIGSIFDHDGSDKQLKKCMQYSISSDQEKQIQDYSNELNKDLIVKINSLNSVSSNVTNATNDILDNTTNEINNLQNESLDNEETINNFKIKIQQLTDKINNSFDTFRDPDNNLLNKLTI